VLLDLDRARHVAEQVVLAPALSSLRLNRRVARAAAASAAAAYRHRLQ
jgi:hypothetical protein